MPAALPTDALAYALAAALCFAALDLAQKWASRYAVPVPTAFLCLRLLGAAIVSPLLLLLPSNTSAHEFPTGAFLLLTVFNLAGNALYLWSIYRADISALGALWPLKNFYLSFLAFLLPPHERFSPVIYALILLATSGAVLVAWNDQTRIRALKAPPFLLMLCATLPVFCLI